MGEPLNELAERTNREQVNDWAMRRLVSQGFVVGPPGSVVLDPDEAAMAAEWSRARVRSLELAANGPGADFALEELERTRGLLAKLSRKEAPDG